MLDNKSLLFLLLIIGNNLLASKQLSLFFEKIDELTSSEGDDQLDLDLARTKFFIKDWPSQPPNDAFDVLLPFLYYLWMVFDRMKLCLLSS